MPSQTTVFVLPPINLFYKFLLTSYAFATNVPQNVTKTPAQFARRIVLYPTLIRECDGKVEYIYRYQSAYSLALK